MEFVFSYNLQLMLLYLTWIFGLNFSEKEIHTFQLGPFCFSANECSKGTNFFHVTELLLKWKSRKGCEVAFRKNILFCSRHFEVKSKKHWKLF